MPDRWAQYAETPQSPPPGADKWAKYAETPEKPGFLQSLRDSSSTVSSTVSLLTTNPFETAANLLGIPEWQKAAQQASQGDHKGAAMTALKAFAGTRFMEAPTKKANDEFGKAMEALHGKQYGSVLIHLGNGLTHALAPAMPVGTPATQEGLQDVLGGDVAGGAGKIAGGATDMVAALAGANPAETGVVVSGAAKGAWRGAKAPATLPIHVRGLPAVEITGVPASVAMAGTGATAGHFIAGPPGAAIGGAVGAAIPVVKGAVRGALADLNDLRLNRTPQPLPFKPPVPMDLAERLRVLQANPPSTEVTPQVPPQAAPVQPPPLPAAEVSPPSLAPEAPAAASLQNLESVPSLDEITQSLGDGKTYAKSSPREQFRAQQIHRNLVEQAQKRAQSVVPASEAVQPPASAELTPTADSATSQPVEQPASMPRDIPDNRAMRAAASGSNHPADPSTASVSHGIPLEQDISPLEKAKRAFAEAMTGDPEGGTLPADESSHPPAEAFKASGRSRKAQRLAEVYAQEGVSYEDAGKITPDIYTEAEWKTKLGKDPETGKQFGKPSLETIQQARVELARKSAAGRRGALDKAKAVFDALKETQ